MRWTEVRERRPTTVWIVLGAMDRATAAKPVSQPVNVPRIGYLIYRAERRLRVRLDEAVASHGITTTEYVTLSVLRERDGLSCAQLARWAFVTPQAMNLVISALERRALIRRRPDPHHGRVLRASVTAKGLKVLERCDRHMDAIEDDMLDGLAPDTIETIREALRSCAHSLEASRPLPRPRPLPRKRNGA
jgi:DNA-binding MarR family transcriptional regulator